MNTIRIFAASIALAALTACGGGSDDPAPDQPTQTECPINLAFATWGGCMTNEEAMKGAKP